MVMEDDVAYVLVTEEQLKNRIRELGEEITRDYAGKEPIFVGVLKGSYIFMSDLVRQVKLAATFDFMQVSSYSGAKSSGVVKIVQDVSQSVEGRDVIIVEDILDTGVTLHYLVELFQSRHPASVKIATLLDKPERRAADVQASYVGFSVPDEFVVGYGLDYDQKYRNLPYVGVLKPEVYS